MRMATRCVRLAPIRPQQSPKYVQSNTPARTRQPRPAAKVRYVTNYVGEGKGAWLRGQVQACGMCGRRIGGWVWLADR